VEDTIWIRFVLMHQWNERSDFGKYDRILLLEWKIMISGSSVKCYVCEQYIVDGNTYDEHIILNALGGRLHSKNLLCRQCSPLFDKIDAELAKQFNPLANLLNVRRHRGEPQPIKASLVKTGEQIFVACDGNILRLKPTFDYKENVGLKISARNEKELKQILNGVKRKNPTLDINKELKSAVKSESSLDTQIEFSIKYINSDEIYRSICKIAINFYVYSTREYSDINHLIPYLKGEEIIDCVKICDPIYEFFPFSLAQDEVFHNLLVCGNSEENILYAVVQIFSTFQYIVILSKKYGGQDFSNSYCFDLTERIAYRPLLEIPHIPRSLILKILGQQLCSSPHFEGRINDLAKFIQRNQHSERLN